MTQAHFYATHTYWLAKSRYLHKGDLPIIKGSRYYNPRHLPVVQKDALASRYHQWIADAYAWQCLEMVRP